MIKKSEKKGFILIEILTSLMIFAVGVVLLVQGLSQITKSSQNIRDNSKAMHLADNILNRLYSGEQVDPAGVRSIDGKDFKWLITELSRHQGMKEIFIQISWNTRFSEYKFGLAHKLIFL